MKGTSKRTLSIAALVTSYTNSPAMTAQPFVFDILPVSKTPIDASVETVSTCIIIKPERIIINS